MDIFRLRSEPVKKERPNPHPPSKYHPFQHHQHWDNLRRVHRHSKVHPSWFSWHPRTWLSLCKLSLERLGERVVTLFTLSCTFNTYCTFRVNMSKKALSDHFPHFYTFTLLVSEKGSESNQKVESFWTVCWCTSMSLHLLCPYHDRQIAVICVNSWELSCEVSCAKSVTLITPCIIKINYFVIILMIVPECS